MFEDTTTQSDYWAMRADRDKWERLANSLAEQVGKAAADRDSWKIEAEQMEKRYIAILKHKGVDVTGLAVDR